MMKLSLSCLMLLSFCYGFAQKSEINKNNIESREVYGEEANRVWQGAEHIWLKQLNTVPAFIEFRKGSEPDEAAFFTIANKLYLFPSNYGFTVIRDEKDDLGWQHKRFQLTINNVPVNDAIFILHMLDGKVKKYNGYLFKSVIVNTSTYIDEASALKYALDNTNAKVYKWQVPGENEHLRAVTGDTAASYAPKGALEIVQVGNVQSNEFKLAWKFDVYTQEPLSRNYVFVDATNGNILKKEPRLYNANTNGTAVTAYRGSRPIVGDSYNSQYRLYETTRGKGIHTWNMRAGTSYGGSVEFLDADNVWNNVNAAKDQYAGDAHWGAEMTYDFYKSMGRNSIDNNGYALNMYMHYSSGYVNAFWDGQKMTFGDGDATYKPLTSLDVTGHEISHGLDENTAGLTYLNESGALNESFSDIFGTAVEWYADSTKGNWTIGEDIGAAFRNMANPNSTQDPDTYRGTNWYTGTADNGGVHTNSNVQNFWYYLLAQGGTGTNDIGSAYNVPALGRHKATQIAWRNMVYYLTSAATYSDSRLYSIQAAADLFGNCSAEVASTTKAWYAVGVGANYTSGAQAQFSGSPLVACTAPAVVNFTNTSSNGGTYLWYFGDNTTSTATNPVHTYAALGTYTVKLVVSGGLCGNDSITKTNYVSVSTNNACSVILPSTGTYQTQTACSGTIYDDGGPSADYTDLSNSTITISPTGASKVKLHFTQFKMEANYDYLYVYDGPSANSPVLKVLTGTTIPTDITSTGSSITIRQSSDNFVNDVGFTIQWSCIQPTTPPVSNFTADVRQSCRGAIQFTDLTTGGASSWLWNFGDGTTSTLQSPLHDYLVSGTYTVTLKVTNSFGSNTATKTNYITISKPSSPSANNVAQCNAGPITLSSTSTNHVAWLDSNGIVVSNQNPFVPSVNTTTTYWLQDSVPQPVYKVGPVDETVLSPGGYFNNPSSAFLALRFQVMKKCKLESVYVNVQGAGYRTIQYRDTAGGVIAQRVINIPDGGSRITLNFDLIPGGPYELGIKDTMNLYRNQGGATWPYTDANNMVTITGNNTYKLGSSTGVNNWYYFYDWNLREPDCVSERKPVTASIGGALNLALSPVNPTCYGGTNGSATVAITGGTPQYTYKWSNGQTSPNATGVAAGSITVTVTDATGCSSSAAKTVTQPTAISPVITATNVSCFGGNNGIANLAVTGGTPGYTYNWGNNITTQNRSGLAAGTYTVIVTDAASCFVAVSKQISQPPVLAGSLAATNVSCFGGTNGTLTLTATGGTPDYTYNWGGGVSSQNRANLPMGNYTVIITDANNCTTTASQSITQATAITPILTATNVRCNGAGNGTLNLTVSGGTPNYTYDWGNNISSQNRTGLTPGIYTVTITDGNGCKSSVSKTISEPGVLDVGLTKTDAKCSAYIGTVTTSVTGGNSGYNYVWSNNQSTPSITGLSAGSYSVTVSDSLNCSTTASIFVNDSFALFTQPSSTNATCYGLYNGTAQINVLNGTPPFTYDWDNGDTAAIALNLAAGTYNVLITDSNQCHGVASFTITQPVAINFQLNIAQPSCALQTSGAAYVQVSGGSPGYSIKWSNNFTTDSITHLTAGNYSVTVTDGNNCTVDSSFNIVDAPPVSVSYTAQNITCYGKQDGIVIIHSSGGSGAFTYSWGGGTFNTDTIRHIPPGNYTITVTDGHNCSASVDVSISQPQQFFIGTSSTDATTGHNNGTASVTSINGGTPPYKFNWSTGDTAQSISQLGPGSYVVTATDHNGCEQVGTTVVGISSGINILSGGFTFQLYPNPANAEVVLEVGEWRDASSFTLKNVLGQQVVQQTIIASRTRLDISLLPAGMYLIEIQKGELRATKQLVVVKP